MTVYLDDFFTASAPHFLTSVLLRLLATWRSKDAFQSTHQSLQKASTTFLSTQNKTPSTEEALSPPYLPGGPHCFQTVERMRRQLLAPRFLGIASFTVVPTCRHTCEDQPKFFHDYPSIGAFVFFFFFLLDLRALELAWENGSGSVFPHKWCHVNWESLRVASSSA